MYLLPSSHLHSAPCGSLGCLDHGSLISKLAVLSSKQKMIETCCLSGVLLTRISFYQLEKDDTSGRQHSAGCHCDSSYVYQCVAASLAAVKPTCAAEIVQLGKHSCAVVREKYSSTLK